MGLFINNRAHPDVFRNRVELKEPNQAYTRQDFMTELLKEQQEANASLKRAFDELKTYYYQQEDAQTNQMNDLGIQVNELRASHHQQEEIESQMLKWLKTLDEKNLNLQTILENEHLQRMVIVNQINCLSDSNQEIVNRMELQEVSQKKLSAQMNEQLQLQKEAVEFQKNVLNRLDNQEALTEKIHRQLNHIRSILFERTNYLATKIEEGYKITSSYVNKLMTGSEQPLTFFLLNQKKEENQQHSD